MSLSFTTYVHADLEADFVNLQQTSVRIPAQSPLYVQTEQQANTLATSVYARLDYPIELVTSGLGKSAQWCHFLTLNPNIKACHSVADGLYLYVGRKHYQAPHEAQRLFYHFQTTRTAEGLKTRLWAEKGPLGTSNYEIRTEASTSQNGGSLIRIYTAYDTSLASRVATSSYLATLGRGKKGFTVTHYDAKGSPIYVKGIQGIIERSAMRYYLALRVHLDSLRSSTGERLDDKIAYWYHASEVYAEQLHEQEWDEYAFAKQREFAHQAVLQQVSSTTR